MAHGVMGPRLAVVMGALAFVALVGCRFDADGFGAREDGGLMTTDGMLPALDARVTGDGSRPVDAARPPDGATPPVDAAVPDAAPRPGVTCVGTRLTSRTTLVDLTGRGTSDWVHWGFASAGDIDRKITGGGQISFAVSGPPGQKGNFVDGITGFTWSDGMPRASNGATASRSGIYIPGNTRGFTITAPSDGQPHRLRLFIGGFRSAATLTATMSDGSGMCTDASFSDASAAYDVEYDLEFRSNSGNATLTAVWTETVDSGGGNVSLQSATLE